MLEKDSRADRLDCTFPSKHDKDSVEEVSSLSSENTRTSNDCSRSNNVDSISSEVYPNDPILDDKNAAVRENLHSYPLGPVSQADDDLGFFDSNHEDKNTTELLYYNWPEMENFEDVDRMFRSCDSTFGLGASIEDDLGWFSSSDVIEGSGGGLRSDFQFPFSTSSALENISGMQEASRPKETDSSINDSGAKDQPFSQTGSSMPSEDESAVPSHLSFANGSSDSDFKIVKKVAGIGTNENLVDKLLHHSVIKHENNKDLGSVSTGIPAEVGSSIVKESSCISSGWNEISEEADSFHQLQHVMERIAMQRADCLFSTTDSLNIKAVPHHLAACLF
ncbi:hypothetical protein RDI58_009934 [Solanum bulbocastanum]|uniref:Uncharacterized protein n=1 Tax=Solanum bulbocastanum TaxID=147425 RepID=A0AAN8TU57_SOLBU